MKYGDIAVNPKWLDALEKYVAKGMPFGYYEGLGLIDHVKMLEEQGRVVPDVFSKDCEAVIRNAQQSNDL